MTRPLTRKDIRDFQNTVLYLANELKKFADNYSKNIALQSKGALMGKYDIIKNYMSQASKQRVDFINLKNKGMVYLFTQEINIFTN